MWIDIIIMAVSALFSGIMTIWSRGQEYKHQQHLASLRIAKVNQEAINASNDMAIKSRGFAFTRRVIALSIVFSYLGGKFYAAYNGITIWVSREYTSGGFSFLGFSIVSPKHSFEFVPIVGYPILPIDYHLLFAVVGLYFGYSIVNRR